jgi:hypothetical protein
MLFFNDKVFICYQKYNRAMILLYSRSSLKIRHREGCGGFSNEAHQ